MTGSTSVHYNFYCAILCKIGAKIDGFFVGSMTDVFVVGEECLPAPLSDVEGCSTTVQIIHRVGS